MILAVYLKREKRPWHDSFLKRARLPLKGHYNRPYKYYNQRKPLVDRQSWHTSMFVAHYERILP